jgi:NADH-quinone oxidoreductase subunit G
MPKLTIDGQEIEVENGTVIIQAAERLGIEIPRFCYHEKLAIAGNCRMCLVEVSPGPPKPQASCALPCAEGMVVKTNTPMVKKAREGVMEFLLINHPLDCPICDQGGECDLQDQAMAYGTGISRYNEHKRSVENKYMGPIVKTEMTRCIHCTRCVRFATEIAGVPELGAFGRGEHMEIGTYVEKTISSELSGNLVDLCPVGALTSRPYQFAARPWELTKTETIDVLDAVGSNIRVDSRGEAVLRILPRVNDEINEEWISDKTRHACDGLRVQRLDRPFVRGNDGKLKEASWAEALGVVASKMKGLQASEMAALSGNLACAESVMALKDLLDNMGVASRDCRQDGAMFDTASRANYLFNTTIAGLEQADVILLIGANPRKEAALLNARFRKTYLKGGLKVYSIGESCELTYPVQNFGADPRVLSDMLLGTHPLAKVLSEAKNPVIILGTASLAREDGQAIFASAKAIAQKYNVIREGWNGLNVLHHAAGRVGALDLGFVPAEGGKNIAEIFAACKTGDVKFVYLLGADEFDMSLLGNAFVVYQGHHGDDGAHRADVILPSAAYTEKDATYVNLEGRVQRTKRAVFPKGEAKEDWVIISELAAELGKPLAYKNLSELRKKMEKIAPHFAKIGEVVPAQTTNNQQPATAPIGAEPLTEFISNFYLTDPISRASKTMAECSKAASVDIKKKVA